MKKQLVSALLCASMVATLLAGCGSSSSESAETTATEAEETEEAAPAEEASTEEASAEETEEAAPAASGEAADVGTLEGKKIGMVVRASGNPYCEKEASGFEEIIEALGGECIILYPESPTAEAQVSLVESLISQNVDAISIAGNDANALSAVLTEAAEAGIKISTCDADLNYSNRATFANQAGIQIIGETLMEAVYDICGGEGQYAILSATSQSTNQNAWIDAMAATAESDSKYANLELVEVAYGDDESQKSTDQTQALLDKYPDLKCICAPTTVGIAAAAKVLQDKESSVKLTGLGLPSEMAEYIGDDDAHSCPYMYLWNPIDLGKLSAYISAALANDVITGAVGDTFATPDLEETVHTVTDNGDGATEVILGPPFKFDPSNIDEWKDVY